VVARHSGFFHIGERSVGAPSLGVLAVFYGVCGSESFPVGFHEMVSHDDDTQKAGREGIESSSAEKESEV
jgi:hypothetical protein